MGPIAKAGSVAGPHCSASCLSLRSSQLCNKQMKTAHAVPGSPNRKVAAQTPRVLEQDLVFHRGGSPAAMSGTMLSTGRD